MKIDNEAISEILVADTDLESGAEASNLEDELGGGEGESKEEEEEQQEQNNKNNNSCSNSKPQQKMNHRLQQVAEDYKAGDHLTDGT
jgi:hypothetical protein